MKDLWIEKYRPQSVKDICGQTHIMSDFHSFSSKKDFPHLLLYGTPGTGKTSTAFSLCNDILGDASEANTLVLDASTDRGIDVIREKVKDFARLSPMGSEFKVIILDECDGLTDAAQHALRRIMEQYSSTCRFILCCNSIDKMIDPIKSRCVMYNFLPPKNAEVAERLKIICNFEHLTHTDSALDYIAETSFGDMRKAVGRLQSISSRGAITKESVLTDTTFNTIHQIIFHIMNANKSELRTWISTYQHEGGDIKDLLLHINNYMTSTRKLSDRKLGKLACILVEFYSDQVTQIHIDAMIHKVIELMREEDKP